MQVVTIDTKGRALQRVAHVSYNAQDRLMWVAMGNGGPWTVTFDKGTDNPFSNNVNSYTVPRGNHMDTGGGPLSGTQGNTYTYSVRDAAGVITDDPDVDVDP